MEVHGFYSEKQLKELINNNNKNKKEPYIFWEKLDGTVVQVTEVTSDYNNYHNNFKDVVYLGQLKKWSHNLKN